MTQGKRCILWIAVSSASQAEETKESLPEQERVLRAIAERNGWRIIDVIITPGHSRDYYTYAEFCEGVRQDRKINTDAPSRMWDHWANRDFDVFACMDGSRFGRKASIVSEFVGRTYDANAQIWSNRDGWIDPTNKRWYAAMIGMQSEGEIAELVRRREMGMKRRAKEGLPTSSSILFSHQLITLDENRQRLIVDPDKRRLLDDLGALIVDGVSWRDMERELFLRFGHADASGRPFVIFKFLRLIQSPTFWGHSAQHFRQLLHHKRRGSTWMFDPSTPPPEGVIIHYHTHESAYTGVQADRIIAELKRRASVSSRQKVENYVTRYSGLLVCAACGCYVTYGKISNRSDKPYGKFYLCRSRYFSATNCDHTKRIHMYKLDEFFSQFLEAILEVHDLNAAFKMLNLGDSQEEQTEDEIKRISGEIDQEQEAIRRLITKQANAPDEISYMYEDEIRQRAAHLAALKAHEAELRNRLGVQYTSIQVIDELQALTLEQFWTLDQRTQNRYLHRILGNKRIAMLDGEILRVINSPPKHYIRKR